MKHRHKHGRGERSASKSRSKLIALCIVIVLLLLLAYQGGRWLEERNNKPEARGDYTERRYVKKPAGAKPGFVIYTHQKTLQATPQSLDNNGQN